MNNSLFISLVLAITFAFAKPVKTPLLTFEDSNGKYSFFNTNGEYLLEKTTNNDVVPASSKTINYNELYNSLWRDIFTAHSKMKGKHISKCVGPVTKAEITDPKRIQISLCLSKSKDFFLAKRMRDRLELSFKK